MTIGRCFSELSGRKHKSNPLRGNAVRSLSTTQPENSIFPVVALDGYGIIFACPIIIFYHHVAGKLEIASAKKHRRGPSTSRYKPFVMHRSARRFAPTARRGRQDDGFVEEFENSRWVCKNTAKSKKSQLLKMTVLWRG